MCGCIAIEKEMREGLEAFKAFFGPFAELELFEDTKLDLSSDQFLIAMLRQCFLCNSDAMSMVFGHSYHRNGYDYFCSTIGTDYFPMFFSNLRTDVWR